MSAIVYVGLNVLVSLIQIVGSKNCSVIIWRSKLLKLCDQVIDIAHIDHSLQICNIQLLVLFLFLCKLIIVLIINAYNVSNLKVRKSEIHAQEDLMCC
jgi:hypothetical protein